MQKPLHCPKRMCLFPQTSFCYSAKRYSRPQRQLQMMLLRLNVACVSSGRPRSSFPIDRKNMLWGSRAIDTLAGAFAIELHRLRRYEPRRHQLTMHLQSVWRLSVIRARHACLLFCCKTMCSAKGSTTDDAFAVGWVSRPSLTS